MGAKSWAWEENNRRTIWIQEGKALSNKFIKFLHEGNWRNAIERWVDAIFLDLREKKYRKKNSIKIPTRVPYGS